MAKKVTKKVDEDMLKDMMMSDIPLYGRKVTTCKDEQSDFQEETVGFEPDNPEIIERKTEASRETGPAKNRKKKEIKEADYRSRFLTNTQASNRSHVYINREVMDCIRRYLPVIAPGVSVSGYLSNIFMDHIQSHWDEINEMYTNESVKPLKQI